MNIEHLDEIVLDENQLNGVLASFLKKKDFEVQKFTDVYVQNQIISSFVSKNAD